MGDGFVKLRRGLVDHLRFFAQSPLSSVVYQRMLLRCNWKTGLVELNAETLAAELEVSVHKIRRSLGWLTTPDEAEMRPPYLIRLSTGNRHRATRWRVINHDGLHRWNWETNAVECKLVTEGSLCSICTSYNLESASSLPTKRTSYNPAEAKLAQKLAHKTTQEMHKLEAQVPQSHTVTATKKREERRKNKELPSEESTTLGKLFHATGQWTPTRHDMRLLDYTIQIFGSVSAAQVEVVRWARYYSKRNEKVHSPANSWIRWMQSWSLRKAKPASGNSLADLIRKAEHEARKEP